MVYETTNRYYPKNELHYFEKAGEVVELVVDAIHFDDPAALEGHTRNGRKKVLMLKPLHLQRKLKALSLVPGDVVRIEFLGPDANGFNDFEVAKIGSRQLEMTLET